MFKKSAIAIAMSLPALSFANTDVATQLEQQAATIKSLQQQVEVLAQQYETSAQKGNAVHIAGYGELHYNNYSGDKDKKEIDFHRFVLEFGYDFSDKIRFFSELELEHALSADGEKGEVELEQAYIEFDLQSNLQAKAGVFLIPVGFLNETHEPPRFYGVERNPVEKNIIPATWWEAGAALSGQLDNGFSYDVALHSGLNTDAFNIRSGRQKVSEASAENLAWTGRLQWRGIQGLELGGTLQYQSDIAQGTLAEDASATLIELHGAYQYQDFTVKGLYAQWDIDGDAAKAAGKDEQKGAYIEPSYKFSEQIGVFYRYNVWNNAAGSTNGGEKNTQHDFGINYWPVSDVVIKADLVSFEQDDTDYDGFNLGIGYQF